MTVQLGQHRLKFTADGRGVRRFAQGAGDVRLDVIGLCVRRHAALGVVGPVEPRKPLPHMAELGRTHAHPGRGGHESRRYETARVRDEGSPLHPSRVADRFRNRQAMQRYLETHLRERDTEHRFQYCLLPRMRQWWRCLVLPSPQLAHAHCSRDAESRRLG